MESRWEQVAKQLLEEILVMEDGERGKKLAQDDFSACLISLLEFIRRSLSLPQGHVEKFPLIRQLMMNATYKGNLEKARELLDKETASLSA